jgi:hypothetical protein
MTDEAKVEIKVRKGAVSAPRGIRINGFEIPHVSRASVDYNPMDARRLNLEILPSDVIEVDEKEW